MALPPLHSSSSPNPNATARLFINNLPRAPQPPLPPPPHQQLPNNTTNNLNYQNIAPRVPQLLSSSPDTTPSHHHHPIVQYPLVSSGRGRLIPTNNNTQQQLPPAAYVPHSGRVGYGYPPGNPIRLTHFPQQQQQGFVVVGNNNSNNNNNNNNNNMVKGFPFSSHPKASSSPSLVFDSNGHKDPSRDVNRDDSLATVRDRKVRIVDGTSLYAQCRSWLRNELPEETQPHYVDGLRSLPKPLPMATPATDAHSLKEKEGSDEEKDEENVDHLSSEDLLQRHIKHAKKVRARLREERLQRIARYKMRLALLLPPMVEQQIRNDTSTAGN